MDGREYGGRDRSEVSRRFLSQKEFFFGALGAVLGVLIFFEVVELPAVPLTDSRLPEAMGVAAAYLGVYLLYWGGTLWQQAGDAEQWRQTVGRLVEKFCSHPLLGMAVIAGAMAAEWVLWRTINTVVAFLEAGVFTLLFLPLLRQMKTM